MHFCITDINLIVFLSLFLFITKYETHTPKLFQAYPVLNNNTLLCHGGFMSVYISKGKFAHLPLSIYIQDEHGQYHQAVAIAASCHYFIQETETFVIFSAAFHGCFMRADEYYVTLIMAIVAFGDKGRVEKVNSATLICTKQPQDVLNHDNLSVSRQIYCNKDSFDITIFQRDLVPPLNMDSVRISSSQSHNCQPKTKSRTVVIFKFPFTDCGTRSEISNGVITYWVNIDATRPWQHGIIFRDSPFYFTVRCSFALARTMQLGIQVKGDKSVHFPTLKNEGLFKAELRFAKDSSYRSFFSSRDAPITIELGQPLHVEVSVPKCEDKELVLLLEHCWATPTADPQDQQRWDLIVNGCPSSGDSQRTVVVPVVSSRDIKYPSLHKWFVVRMFSFVKPSDSVIQVYFHCDIEICRGTHCTQSCNNDRRKLRGISAGERILHRFASGGPLHFVWSVKLGNKAATKKK